jgi:hypothetical protein
VRVDLATTAMVLTVLVCTSCGDAPPAPDIFTTDNFREDEALWTDPAYYRNNTVNEFMYMQVEERYAEGGSGEVGAVDLASPYPFTTALEHYQAWLTEASGGTTHTYQTMPDWRGRWLIGETGLDGGRNPASTMAEMLTPQYREAFVQEMKALAEGRIWEPGAFCLPGGYQAAVVSAEEFIVTPDRVWTIGAENAATYIRWIYTDGSGHTPEEARYPRWHGGSVGFWDGDALVVYTNQIRGWKGVPGEFSDNLETIERYQRVGDAITAEVTLYDPEVFVRPYHAKMRFERDQETRPELRPLFNTCTDTNGPSAKVHLDENGLLNERIPGDPLYWDATDDRPWATFFNLSDERYERYLAEAEGSAQ